MMFGRNRNRSPYLEQFFYNEDPPGPITPIEYDERLDREKVSFYPLSFMGVFNPMGPTLVTAAILNIEDCSSLPILCCSYNPFQQTKQITAIIEFHEQDMFLNMGLNCLIGEDFPLQCYPTFVMEQVDNEVYRQGHKHMLRTHVDSTPTGNGLQKEIQDMKEHWADPWERIPDMAEMMASVISGSTSDSKVHVSSDEDFETWYSMVTDREHYASELRAILVAWEKSQKFSGLPGMNMEDLLSELGHRGFLQAFEGVFGDRG